MRVALLLAFIAFPLLEIALLIRTGQVIGLWPTIAVVVGTAFLGATLLRQQGFKVLGRLTDELAAGRTPLEPLADGAMLLVAGACLVAPGLITDVLGLLLLIPPVRTAIRRFVVARALQLPHVFIDIQTSRRTSTRSDDQPFPGPAPRPDLGEGPVIEGEFERIDETTTRDPRR